MRVKKAVPGEAKRKKNTKVGASAVAKLCKCSQWQAWLDLMPPNPGTLHVVGFCVAPTHGYKIWLKPGHQGFNPKVLVLDRIVKPPTGPVIMIPELLVVHYEKRTKEHYTHVEIRPEGKIIRVKTVR